ncbi:MAG: peptidoglycan DD-metalloendopeptidase family protein, partial [Anaerolineales bacterium]
MKNSIPRSIPIYILVVFALGILGHNVNAGKQFEELLNHATQNPLQDPIDETKIKEAIKRAVSEEKHYTLAYFVGAIEIEEIKISNDGLWARAWLVPFDPKTGQPIPTEPGLVISKRAGELWEVWLPTTPGWLEKVRQAPESILSQEHKDTWVKRLETQDINLPSTPFSGYLLPWEAGVTVYLTQSTCHDSYITSGNAHYSFDFSIHGTMWDTYAAKSGEVWLWKDDVPTCFELTCNDDQPLGNYMVLRDTTTDPVTYQLYLHLAQDSIPPELKARGTPVTQGQFLGVVDNTGQSWGHHLHFQVQVPLYGDNYYWGKSVDITFDDVDINGGRPRVINSFCDDSFYCTYPNDVCDDFRAEYVSQNVPTDDNTPPDGDILNPINGITVYSNTLRLEGWATDEGSGLDNAQFRARYNGTWHDVGPPFDTSLFGHTWNLCADNVPDGPISISMTLRDKNGNQTSDFPGLRHFTKHYACNPVVLPPGCTPRSNEVALFSEVNYGGTCQILGEGSHRSGITLGAVGDNNTDSILIGDQVAATLFTEVNYSSRAESLTRSDANLNENLTGVNTLSSLKVYSIEEPPSTPYPIFPESGSTYTDTDSLSLIWRDAGGATHFRTRLQSTSTSITTPWQIQPYWNIGSLITGTYTWTLQASTPFSNSMWSQPYTFTVQKNPIPHTIKFTSPFSDSLEGSTDGWSKSGLWNLSDDGSKAHSGTHSWWYGQLDSGSYDSGNTLNQGDLTTPVITLPVTTTNYLMQFWYQYESESEHIHWDQRWVQISIDQEPYTNVLQLYDDPMGGWLKTSIDLSPYISAIMTHTLQARFHFSTMDAIDNTFSGWLIDDVQILASQSLACNVDDEPNDSSVQAIPINYGDSLTGSICPQGDHDYFKFTGELGDRLVADIDAKSEGSTLDSFLFLIDEDGSSVLAEHDDELLGVRQDPHLGYVLPRDGDYYLLLRAWDNPQGIGDYNLSLIKDHQDPSLVIAYPENEGFLPNSTITIQTVPNDQESGIQSIRFLWHSGDWADDDWIDLGIDEDGDDGWGVNFDAASPEEQDQVAFYAYAYDWAGNWH